ncbi:hypothetical protein [Pseudoduganella namucuonensis]|uniref:DUF4124 domain-containing protein n=1 Tax=Pseudoduganella namucuonensis TaxID=1035707 RepID=A0A1I7LJ33_9BURK|nr:hypothetical protein [Pseudoduganella namucuonensis]SFV09648.1 hypothetical protein SAMN05216552_103055 [Pseudoduganella namucuonensis]
MMQRQRGLSLIAVALLMGGLAAAVMAALFSMRHERNLFAEGADKLMRKSGAEAVVKQAAPAAAPAAPLRRCVIDGRTVVSNTECKDGNPTSKTIQVRETRGIEAPRVPKPDPAESGAPSLREKMINQGVEKATR